MACSAGRPPPAPRLSGTDERHGAPDPLRITRRTGAARTSPSETPGRGADPPGTPHWRPPSSSSDPRSPAASDALARRLQATTHTTQNNAAGLAHSGRPGAVASRRTGRRVHDPLERARTDTDDTDTTGRHTPASTQHARTKRTIMDARALDYDSDTAYGDARRSRRRTGPLSSPVPAVDGAGRAPPRTARGCIARTRTAPSRVALRLPHVRTEPAPCEQSTTATRATHLPANSAPGQPRSTTPTPRPERSLSRAAPAKRPREPDCAHALHLQPKRLSPPELPDTACATPRHPKRTRPHDAATSLATPPTKRRHLATTNSKRSATEANDIRRPR